MFEGILPSAVAVVAAQEDLVGVALFPEEADCVAGAVESRRREFATGRHCARVALSRLGIGPVPIGKDDRGAPRWPPGVVGSITHCAGSRAAAVARRSDVVTLGIDAEPHGPLPTDVLTLIATPDESRHLAELADASPGVAWDRVLFSAKESVYKAWFPLVREFLDFTAAEVTFSPADATFVARLLAQAILRSGEELSELAGRYAVTQTLVTTAVLIDARSE